MLRRLLPALLLLLAVSACSDDSSDGDGSGDGDGRSADKAWLDEDVCALLPDGILEQVVEDPAAATPQPRTPDDLASDVPDGVRDAFGDNQTECSWEDGTDSITVDLFDPPFPELFTDTEADDALTVPYEVEGGTAYVDEGVGGCYFYLPTEPAWVTVDLTAYDDDLLDDVEPDACAIAAEAATGVADTLGWELAED